MPKLLAKYWHFPKVHRSQRHHIFLHSVVLLDVQAGKVQDVIYLNNLFKFDGKFVLG